MTNKIGLTFLLAWFAVMAIVANYSYDRNVPYRGNTGDEYASKMCRLDIAYQPDVQNAPVVVWFHGGGLTGGSRNPFRVINGRHGSRRCRIPFVSACEDDGDRR